MSGEELKEALLKSYRVRYNGIVYAYIDSINYRAPRGRIVVSATLMDFNRKTLVVAPADKVEREVMGDEQAERPVEADTGGAEQGEGQGV